MKVVKPTAKILSLICVAWWIFCLAGITVADSLGIFSAEENGIMADFVPVVLRRLSFIGLVFSSLLALSVFTFWSRKNTGPRWLRVTTLSTGILSNLLCLVMVVATDSRIANCISKLGIHLDLFLILPVIAGIVCVSFLVAQMCIFLTSRNRQCVKEESPS